MALWNRLGLIRNSDEEGVTNDEDDVGGGNY